MNSSLTINANNVFKLTVDNSMKSTVNIPARMGAPQSSEHIGSFALSLNGQSYNSTWSNEYTHYAESYEYQRKISVNFPSQAADIVWTRNINAGQQSPTTNVNIQLRSDKAKQLELNIDHLNSKLVTDLHVHLVADVPEKVFLYSK